jgi:hydrogenase nickel incorporation protein HypA/HybF
MHELSIAMSILDLAAEEAERHGNAEVCVIRLRLGPLSGVVKQALVSAYELAREGTAMAATELVIEDVSLAAHCPTCGIDCEPASVFDLRCPTCGTPTPRVVRGRELEVVSLEIAT